MLTDPFTGKTAPELVAISEAMNNMKPANSGLTWIKQPHVRSFFEQVRSHLVFGQPIERLIALNWDNVNIAGDPVLIRLGMR